MIKYPKATMWFAGCACASIGAGIMIGVDKGTAYGIAGGFLIFAVMILISLFFYYLDQG